MIIEQLATLFVVLQQRRYEADYDLSTPIAVDVAINSISQAEEFLRLATTLRENHATDFQHLMALLLLRKTSNLL